MKTNCTIATFAAAAIFLTNCTSPESKGWHRPARPGERVGQVMEVQGTKVTISIDESCLVHDGDVLAVKRLYCPPGAGKKGTKGCVMFDSGTISVISVNASDHTAAGKIYEGSATVDAPVYMTDRSLSDRFPRP